MIKPENYKVILYPTLFILVSFLIASTGFNNNKSNSYVSNEFEEVVFTTRRLAQDPHWYANIGYYAFDKNEKLYTSGSTLSRLNISTGELKVLFHDGEGTFRDPQMHYDGKRILFSYRKGNTEHFHLYETDIEASYLTQLTSGPYSDIEPTYLPDGDIIFVSTRCECWVNCWSTQVATLHRCSGDGSDIKKISANIEHDNTPWPLSNGQIMYTRWEYVDRSQVHFHHLWIMNPDGSKQSVLFGNQSSAFQNANSCLLIDAKPVPWSGDTILATYSPGHGRKEHAGFPVLIALNNGPDDKNAYQFIGERKGSDLLYDPYPINHNLFMASSGKELILFDRNRREQFSYKLPGDFIEDEQFIFEPRPVMSRLPETLPASTLEKDLNYGTIIIQDVYQGRNMSKDEENSIDKLLILETLRKPINYTGGNEPLSYTGSFTMERIVGTVPVREDGSAHFKLPSDRPYLFVALDDEDRAIQKMKSFTSVAPGEVISCIGCHEKRSLAPENKDQMPLALTDVADFPEKVDGIPSVMDFPRDIQPILDRHCIKCHDSKTREGGILLTGDRGPVYSHGYFNLMAHFQVNDGLNHPYPLNKPGMVGDRYSPMIEKIENNHGDVVMTKDEIRMIRYWINTGALYPGTYGALGTGMVGTMTNNNVDLTSVENNKWDKASGIIKNKCQKCHNELMSHVADEKNLIWWRSRVDVTSGAIDQVRYKEAIRFSRHIIYDLTDPERSTILMAPLSKEAGGYGLCRNNSGKSIFENVNNKEYIAILEAVKHSSSYLNEIKRFDMKGFVVRPDYYREMIRFEVIGEDIPIDKVNPYVTDSIYWAQQ